MGGQELALPSPAVTPDVAVKLRRSDWRAQVTRALLSPVLRQSQALLTGCLLGALLASPPAPAATEGAPNPPPPQTLPTPDQQLEEVIVQTTEPKFVAPTRRDSIGRIWAPVLINGKGPYRLVLDTGATSSAITVRAAQSLGGKPDNTTRVTGFTGTAVVPTLHVSSMEVGELLIGPTELPVLSEVFGGAQGVLGMEGLANKRIYADFTRDRLEISKSRGERARIDFQVVPLTFENGLLVAEVRVGSVRTKAIIDTGAQATVGNMALRDALMRNPPGRATQDEVIGVTLDVQKGDDLPAPDITIAKIHIQGARLTFGDMYLFRHWKYMDEPTLALGMDLLGSFDVLVIDYNRRELQIRPH
jgi:predicted aspartyl protease